MLTPRLRARLLQLPSGRVAREGAWVAAGQVSSALAALVSIRIMTELLSPEDFGRLTLLVGMAALALGLAATPRLQALMRYYADWSRNGRTDVVRRVGARSIASLVALGTVVIAGGWAIGGPLIGSARVTGVLVAALFAIDGIRLFELSLLNAARRQRTAAAIYAADAWLRPLLAVATVWALGASANSALAGYVLGSALVVIAMRLVVRLEGRADAASGAALPAGQSEADLASAIRRYAWPLAPLAIFGWISGMGDRYVIGGLLDLGQAGLYAAAYGLASRPFLMMSSMIELTMRPILQNAIAARDTILITRMKRMFLMTTAAGAATGVAAFALLSGLVADVLLAAQYHSAATELMPWIALGYAFYVVAIVFSRFCYAFDDTRAVLIQTVVGSAIGIAVLFPTIHYAGLWGAAAAVPIRFLVELVLVAMLARRAERAFFHDGR